MKVRWFLIGVMLAAVALGSQSLAHEPSKALPIAAPPQAAPLYDDGRRLSNIEVWCALETRCDIRQLVQQMGVCGLYVILPILRNYALHHGRGVGGQLVSPQMNGTARPSLIRIFPTSLPSTSSVPQ